MVIFEPLPLQQKTSFGDMTSDFATIGNHSSETAQNCTVYRGLKTKEMLVDYERKQERTHRPLSISGFPVERLLLTKGINYTDRLIVGEDSQTGTIGN